MPLRAGPLRVFFFAFALRLVLYVHFSASLVAIGVFIVCFRGFLVARFAALL